jgi:hypothetical protein
LLTENVIVLKTSDMKKHQLIPVSLFFILPFFLAACATIHPNEKMLVGTWKTIKVEKYIDESAMQAAAPVSTATPAATAQAPKRRSDSAAGATPVGQVNRAQDKLERLIRAEERAVLVIDSSHIATKQDPGVMIRGTWKMKSNGMVVIAKNMENKEKVRMEIVEISDNQITIIQSLPVGALKITYTKHQ